MTWRGWLNFLVLQWLGIRLARITHVAFVGEGESTRADLSAEGWGLIVFPAPLTGWWSDYWPEPRVIRLGRRGPD